MSKKIKIFVIVVAAIIVIILAVSFLGGSKTPAPTSGPLSSSQLPAGVAGNSTGATVIPNDFSILLSTVKNITIDSSIFDNPTYKSLRDHPVNLGSENIGRPNPFAPVGIDIGTITGATTGAPVAQQQTSIETLQPIKITPTTAVFGARTTLVDTTPGTLMFEYGPTDLFGSVTTPLAVTTTDTYLFNVTGLAPATTYSVRAILVRGSTSSVKGTTMIFTTPAKSR